MGATHSLYSDYIGRFGDIMGPLCYDCMPTTRKSRLKRLSCEEMVHFLSHAPYLWLVIIAQVGATIGPFRLRSFP